MVRFLEQTLQPRRPVESWEAVHRALAQAFAPPHPQVTLLDEWGNLMRVEGRPGQLILESRRLETDGVGWFGLGRGAPPGVRVPVHLTGRVVKVAPSERLDAADVEAAFAHFFETGRPPDALHARPLEPEHGRLWVMATSGEEPRPVTGWAEVARQLDSLPRGQSVMVALSEPERILVGLFGAPDRFAVRVRESRGGASSERRVAAAERRGGSEAVAVGAGEEEIPAHQILAWDDAVMVMESLYRHDAPPPGFLFE